jgi:hypothetical protein
MLILMRRRMGMELALALVGVLQLRLLPLLRLLVVVMDGVLQLRRQLRL